MSFRPCLFCDSPNIDVIYVNDWMPNRQEEEYPGYYQVRCRTCFARGPAKKNKLVAERLWEIAEGITL